MQHGAKSATPPAKNAASTEPVVSRSPTGATTSRQQGIGGAKALLEKLGELSARESTVAEEGGVDQDQRAHRGPVPRHQLTPCLRADVDGVHDQGEVDREGNEGSLRVDAEVAGLGLHDGHLDRGRCVPRWLLAG